MKSTSILVPIAFLLAGGVWIITQLGELSEVKKAIGDLEKRIKTPSPMIPSTQSQIRKTALDRKQVDWGQVASELENKSASGMFKDSLQLEEGLRALSAQEIKDALQKAEEGDLDKASFRRLTWHLLNLLLKADPSYILTHASRHPDVADLWTSQQGSAIDRWTKLAPSDAVAWFDSQAPDAFPPEQRKTLELYIVSSLAIVDFEQAKNRLSAIPENIRHKFFGYFSNGLAPGLSYYAFGSGWSDEMKSGTNLTGRFAELTRLLPENRSYYIASPLTMLGEQEKDPGIRAIQQNLKGWEHSKNTEISLELINDYFQKIDPTPTEIDLCIEAIVAVEWLELAGQPKREPEALRAWLQSELNPLLKSE